MKVTKDRINKILDKFKDKNIFVLGDVMLDRYIWGKVTRISPEAPIPIVHVQRESSNLGGAANVAGNLAAMGCKSHILGVVGEDPFGEEFIELAKKGGIETEGLLKDRQRETTVKTRVIAHHQHIVRVDRESTDGISLELENKILLSLEKMISQAHGLIIEDYNKGLLSQRLIQKSIQIARKNNKIVTVDPKFDHFFDYKGVTLFKPNRREIASAMGTKIETDEELRKSGLALCKKLNCEAVLVTRGEEGMTIFYPDGKIDHLETFAREVYDVSGAGDTVISAVTLALAAGATFGEAAYIANHAAAIAIAEVGAFPVSLEELREVFS